MNGKSNNIDLTLMFPGMLITLLVGVAPAHVPVLLIMVFSLMKWVKEDYGELLARKVAVLRVEFIKKWE